MTEAELLLNGLSDEQIAAYTATPETEPHIVIGQDRFITVPDELKRIGVQYDHNIETVTFDCPRYWDGHDMSKMRVYVNYMRADNYRDCYLCENVAVDESDESMMHFDWTLSGNATAAKGTLSFLVCTKKVDEEGNEANHWNSELNRDMYLSEGLECGETVLQQNPDIITALLLRMQDVEAMTTEKALYELISSYLSSNPDILREEISKVVSEDTIEGYIRQYLEENPVDVDNTLTKEGVAADAAAVRLFVENSISDNNVAIKKYVDEAVEDIDKKVSDTMVNAVNEMSHLFNGVVVPVQIENWIANDDGKYTNTVTVDGVLADESYDVFLYGDNVTDEQAKAFDESVVSIETFENQIVLEADEPIAVAFNILLKGRMNLENKNVYVSDLSATSMSYDNTTSKLEAGDVQNAIDEVNNKLIETDTKVESRRDTLLWSGSVDNENVTLTDDVWNYKWLIFVGNSSGAVTGAVLHTIPLVEGVTKYLSSSEYSHNSLTGGSTASTMSNGLYFEVINDTTVKVVSRYILHAFSSNHTALDRAPITSIYGRK